jgi:hypothetical protein
MGEGQLMRGASSSLARFLSSSCPSHAFWNWLGIFCCPAVLLLLRNLSAGEADVVVAPS